jgi:DNA-binding transcriptional LysR family regulator
MEIRLLRSFQLLAEEGHFGRAARALHLSQPALTKQVKQLEEEIGAQLFVRGRHGAQLTRLGRLFEEEVTPLLRHVDRVVDRARRAARGELGELRLGFGVATRLLVPRLVSRFRRARPEVIVTLRDMSTAQQVDALRRGTLDVGFVRLPVERPLAHIPVVEDRLLLAVPVSRRDELARRPLQELSGEPFVELSASRSPSYHAHVLRVCARYGFRPRVVQSATEFFTVLAFVSAGMGIAVVPSDVTVTRVEGVSYVALNVPEALWRVGAAWIPGIRNAVRDTFIELLADELRRAGGLSGHAGAAVRRPPRRRLRRPPPHTPPPRRLVTVAAARTLT